jgi:parallel beta-helix repeat protein
MSTLEEVKVASKKLLLILFLVSLLLTVAVCTLESANAVTLPFTGEIRITADGTVEGTDKISRNGNVYTLTGNISGSVDDGSYFISIEKDDVVFDGAGNTIEGTNSGTAIVALGRVNLTIKNVRIVNFGTGIELRAIDFYGNSTGTNNHIADNYFDTKYWGLSLNTNNGFVSGNTIVSQNSIYGVYFEANQTSFFDNVFQNGGLVIYNPGINNMFSNNTINGKSLVVLEGQSNQVIDDANQVILINCKNMVVQNVDNIGLRNPLLLFGTNDTRICHCQTSIVLTDSHSNTLIENGFSEKAYDGNYNGATIELLRSHNNTITQNLIKAAGCNGIFLSSSAYNKIEKNHITSYGSDYAGIRLELSGCEYNYIYENSITSEAYGVFLRTGADNNVFFKNNIYQCNDAIMMSGLMQNDFLGNNISGSIRYAVNFAVSDFNNFFWNNFENNTQVYESHSVYWWIIQNDTYYSEYNQWDNGKEGNYWSDYTGSDTNGDGIGETPYRVYENFTDNYPLTQPYDTGEIHVDFEEWVPETVTTPQLQTETPTTTSPSENNNVSDSFPLVPVVTVSGAVAVVAVAAVLWHFKKLSKPELT